MSNLRISSTFWKKELPDMYASVINIVSFQIIPLTSTDFVNVVYFLLPSIYNIIFQKIGFPSETCKLCMHKRCIRVHFLGLFYTQSTLSMQRNCSKFHERCRFKCNTLYHITIAHTRGVILAKWSCQFKVQFLSCRTQCNVRCHVKRIQ